MRKTRSNWQNALFLVPVIFVAAGLQYLSKHHDGNVSEKVSFTSWIQSKLHSGMAGLRAPASHDSSPESVNQLKEIQKNVKKKIAKLNVDEDEPTEDLAPKTAEARTPAAFSTAANTSGFCKPSEFPGRGLEVTQVSPEDWQGVMDQFHSAKVSLLGWLKSHQTQFSPKTYSWMAAQISETRIQRPSSPALDSEPDLGWRGIAVPAIEKTETGQVTPVIRLGGGFLQQVSNNPQRARFELARLLAQNWAPCALHSVDPSSPWKDFLNCMNLNVEADAAVACGSGSYSEAGWAVSTAVAAITSPPGCRVPAFEGASSACVKKMGANL